MEKKELIRELINKIWTGDYPDNNDGINQCKMDLQTVEEYIEDLEIKCYWYDKRMKLLRCILKELDVKSYVISTEKYEEYEKSNVDYYIDWSFPGQIVLQRVYPKPYYGEAVKKDAH